MGNAHRSRPRAKPCPTGCIYCAKRPKEGPPGHRQKNYDNQRGHRTNPTRKKKGRRRPSANAN
jgi:hypothetical protein